ncbi:uncharacterized protein PV09_02107 [Verruconis gallopava]|uniref:Uncharacterized protein n=1 Tax=Verruconis gallopava TaxID=253628 RepID=A0A0D1Z2R9_9PEZI|nr:uncharacterized protein PV09_02107 [Verruconis gallopava]KIW07252.1 hypothetical protein PV09_02107 [Verruconis gallopava]
MPLQKARDTQPNPTKPLMPSLASNRNVKPPLTPRLAANATPPLAKSSRTATPNTLKPSGTKDEGSTPSRAFINNNVTPRSGTRKSRVESSHSTPSGTPHGSRPASQLESIGNGGKQTSVTGFGLGIMGSGNRSRPSSTVGVAYASNPPSVAPQPKLPRLDSQTESPMFFHASDVPRSPELRSVTKKSPVFLYANGQQEESAKPISHPSPTLSSVSTKSKKSQFFHADGRADEDIPPVPSLPSPSLSGAPLHFFQPSPALRPPSPAKDSNFHLSYRKGASQIIRPAERPKTISILPPSGSDARKQSIGGFSTQITPHKRTSSLSSIESGSSARKPFTGVEATGLSPLQTIIQAQISEAGEHIGASGASGPSSPGPEIDPLGQSTSSAQSRERQTSPSSPSFAGPQSPTKGPSPWQNQLNETIMNARVERKIQDLEISNSSLMAINKSLEKEVRRQNRELRRFRRLSRAGRLSTLSGIESLEIVGEEVEFEVRNDGLSALDDFSEDDEEYGYQEDESSDESSSNDSASLSPEAMAERQERKLAKDSKRLQLDLAKHREILVDSQKLNQSLKRCMAWTELMIKDGRKALQYKAETDLGGRILDYDENEDDECEVDGAPRHSLLSSWTPSPIQHLEALDGMLGLDTSELTRSFSAHSQEASTSRSMTEDAQKKTIPDALAEGNFWSVAAALE